MNDTDAIWHRALAMNFKPHLPGDSALQVVLWFHNLTMNGGVLHAIEQRDDNAMNIIEAGYRWFDLEDVSDLIASTRREIASGALEDDQRGDALEIASNHRYDHLIPTDEALERALRQRVQTDRRDFE